MTSTQLAIIENIATIICTAAVILSGLYMGVGCWSFLGLVLLINMNTRISWEPKK